MPHFPITSPDRRGLPRSYPPPSRLPPSSQSRPPHLRPTPPAYAEPNHSSALPASRSSSSHHREPRSSSSHHREPRSYSPPHGTYSAYHDHRPPDHSPTYSIDLTSHDAPVHSRRRARPSNHQRRSSKSPTRSSLAAFCRRVGCTRVRLVVALAVAAFVVGLAVLQSSVSLPSLFASHPTVIKHSTRTTATSAVVFPEKPTPEEPVEPAGAPSQQQQRTTEGKEEERVLREEKLAVQNQPPGQAAKLAEAVAEERAAADAKAKEAADKAAQAEAAAKEAKQALAAKTAEKLEKIALEVKRQIDARKRSDAEQAAKAAQAANTAAPAAAAPPAAPVPPKPTTVSTPAKAKAPPLAPAKPAKAPASRKPPPPTEADEDAAAPFPVVDAPVLPTPSTSLTTNPVMSASFLPKAADGVSPLISPPSTPLYSSFYCIGGRGREGSGKDRSCRFHNLCYRPATGAWQFHQPNTSKDALPILLDHGRVITQFPGEFVDLTTAAGGRDAWYWWPHQVYDEIPAGALAERRNEAQPDVYLMYAPHYGANLGRVLADDLFALFNLQLSFGMLSNGHTLLQVQDCTAQFSGAPRKTALCHAVAESVASALSVHPPLVMHPGISLQWPRDLVCFEQLLVGTGPFGYSQSLGRASTWWRFHAFVLENLGFDHNHTPRRHRISLAITTGDRTLANQKELAEHLTAAFPSHQVDPVELHAMASLKHQVAYLLDTTVLITISGEKAIPALFLPQHAALIIVDHWDLKADDVAGTDDRLWSNLGYLRAMWYPFVEAEVELEGDGRSRDKQADMRDYGRVRVNLQRMEAMVRAAIAHVDGFMLGKGQE